MLRSLIERSISFLIVGTKLVFAAFVLREQIKCNYKFLNFETKRMNKTYRHDKKGHDDYLLSSNRVLNSEKSEQDSKKMNFRKLSLSSNPLLQEKERSVALKFNSLTKISQKSIPKSNRKFKGSTHNDEYVVKTMRTEETVEKKYKHSLEPKTSIKTSKNASEK